MDSKIKKLTAGIALAGALTVGTAGAAFAADSSTNSPTTPSAQTAGHPGIRAEFRRGAVKDVAETLGVSRARPPHRTQGRPDHQPVRHFLGSRPKDGGRRVDDGRQTRSSPSWSPTAGSRSRRPTTS